MNDALPPNFGSANNSLNVGPISLSNLKANRKRGILAAHNGFQPGQAPVIRNVTGVRYPNGKKAGKL